MKFSTLIIGLGQIGMGYDLHFVSDRYVYSHARAFSKNSRFHLVAGVDSNGQRRNIFTRTYGCPAYDRVEIALENHQSDLVIIAVPTRFHSEIMQIVLERSQPKMILCEKPISYDLQEARHMVQMCSTRHIELYVNYVRRSDPGVIEIKRRLDSGEIAHPVKGVVWYSKGFLHNGSHFFNLLQYWLGEVVDTQILAMGRALDLVDREPDVRISFERGTILFLAVREEDFSHYTVELIARNGRLRYDKSGKQIDWQAATSDPNFIGYTVLSDIIQHIESGMHCYQWHVAEQLANVLDGRAAEMCSGADALHTLENMKLILEKIS